VRVLAITNEFPLPLDRGGPVRFFGLLRALARDHDVHLLALRRPSTTPELAEELRSTLGGPVELFDRPPAGAGATAGARRWTRALAGGVPPWIAAQHSPRLERRARALAPGMDAVAVLDDFAGTYVRPLAKAAPVVWDRSNVMGASTAAAPAGGGPRARLQRRLAIHLSRRFERSALRGASGVVATSEEESERLSGLYGRRADAIVPSAVDVPELAFQPHGRHGVGWLGSLEYEANVEGLVRFVAEGWEPLGADGYRLLVAGGGPPPESLRLDHRGGVELLGYVERLEDLYAQLGAAVVPLWRGAGVKLKTLTFMAAGVPVVGTPAAVEGIAGEDGRHYLVAADPPGLAAALRRVLDDPELARGLSREGRRLVEERYSWAAVGAGFCHAVERAAGARP
jgi:glycosyltransferase involved in cell wall biosynthesis